MRGQEKAARGNLAASDNLRAPRSPFVMIQYTMPPHKTQDSASSDVSRLIDQAVQRAEYAQEQVLRWLQLAHKHRKVRASLEVLAFWRGVSHGR